MEALIKRANLTQRQLSDRANVTERSINSWKRGAALPTLDRALAVARVLGVSLYDLCESLGLSTDGIPETSSIEEDEDAT